MRTFHVIISVLVVYFTLGSHNEPHTHIRGVWGGSYTSFYGRSPFFFVHVRRRAEREGGVGALFFCRLPCRLFFLLRFFFLNQNKRGGEGGAGVPRAPDVDLGGGGGGAFFVAWPAGFSSFCDSFF